MMPDWDDRPEDVFRRYSRAGERVLWLLMTVVVILTLVFSIVIMIDIGGGRSNLADRLVIAVVAIAILGAVDTQATRLAQRRRPLLAPDPPGYRRFVILTSLGLLAAACLLLGLAWYLP
jgi:hypothetical protein